MSLCLKIFAVGGMLYYFETKTGTVYLKKSRKARLPITFMKYVIIIGFIALVFASEVFFIKGMFSL